MASWIAGCLKSNSGSLIRATSSGCAPSSARTPSTSPALTASPKSSTGGLVSESILCLSFAQLSKP